MYGDSGANLPTDISVQDGTASFGKDIFVPIQQAGLDWEGSEMTQVEFPQALIEAYRRTGTTGNAYVHWTITGYLL
jgi:hypothetical protein